MKKNRLILLRLIFLISLVCFAFPQLKLLEMKMNQQSYKNFQLLQGGVAFKMDDSITQSMSSLVETGEIIGRIEFLNESLILLE